MKKLSVLLLFFVLVAVGIYSCNKQGTEQKPTDERFDFSGLQQKVGDATGKYQSLIQGSKTIEIELNDSNGTIYYTKYETTFDSIIGSRVYNKTGVQFVNQTFEVPQLGTYWFIPFDEDVPVELIGGTKYCYDCLPFADCNENPCEWTNVGGGVEQCHCSGGDCFVQRRPCEGSSWGMGSGLIVAADYVVKE